MTGARIQHGDAGHRDYERQELFRVLEPVARENLELVQERMADADVDALIINRSDSLRYLVGYGPTTASRSRPNTARS